MNTNHHNALVRKTIFYSFTDVTFYTLMVAFGESMVMLYIARESPNSLNLAFLTSIPTAIGAVTQILAPRILFRNSPRRLLLASVFAQAIGVLILFCSLFYSRYSLTTMGIGLSIYWMGGMGAAAPWQQVLSELIPTAKQNRFFANRNGYASFVMLLCNLIIGLFLANRLERNEVLLFLAVAFMARLLSLFALWRHPVCPPAKETIPPSTVEATDEVTISNPIQIPLAHIVFFMFVVRFGVMLAGPFFNPYMINTLNLPVLSILILSSVPLMTRTLLNGNWGRLLDSNRMYEGLAISAIGICALPSLWTLSSNFSFLVGLQIASGLFWSGFELLTVLLIQRMYREKTMSRLALALAAAALGSTLGGLTGGRLLDWDVPLFTLFHLSSTVRLVGAVYLLYILRRCGAFRFRSLNLSQSFLTVFSIRPWWDFLRRGFLATRS
jgi:MFS family permease